MFTFKKFVDESFMPCIRRSDGIVFSLETLQDLKALGFDTEHVLQDPTWVPTTFTKVVDDDGQLHFYDPNGQEALKHQKENIVVLPQTVIDEIRS